MPLSQPRPVSRGLIFRAQPLSCLTQGSLAIFVGAAMLAGYFLAMFDQPFRMPLQPGQKVLPPHPQHPIHVIVQIILAAKRQIALENDPIKTAQQGYNGNGKLLDKTFGKVHGVLLSMAAEELPAGGMNAFLARGVLVPGDIEANETLSKKDFRMRIEVLRKESKETRYWLRLLDTEAVPELDAQRDRLVRESSEWMRIFAAILRKSESDRLEHSSFGF